MNTKNIAVAILGLGLVAGLGVLAVNSNNKISEEPNNIVEVPENNKAEFGKLITFKVSDGVTFSDGLHVRLFKIDDSRCPEGAQCIWAGELSYIFVLSKDNKSLGEIQLGTMTAYSRALEGYRFMLGDGANEVSVNVSVYKE